ncbi:MAG: DUF3360 family protein [Dethiobacter sp.]|jgi:hypothetical protein|nr:DUF3360 family protein [Dethiobacter sp.]MBS3899862.1 DUF3360 family protein [Dethiobacter sp.]
MVKEPTTTETGPELSYEKLYRPAKEFKSRSDYLDHELQIINPKNKGWGFLRPGKDFRFELEDLLPAIAGTIGGSVLAFGIVGAYATGFGLPHEFLVENVRLELVIVGLFMMLFHFLNPRLGGVGQHGWMIPLIPLVVAAGGHPLALGVTLGVLGLALSFVRGGALLQALTPNGVVAGMLIFFGVDGMLSQIRALNAWTTGLGIAYLFTAMAMAAMLVYALLAKLQARWAAIPACTAVCAIIALAMGAPFQFQTAPGFPNFNPFYWWGADTGWMLGMPTLEQFIAVIPFAIIGVVMWPPDAIGLIAFQRAGYPAGTEKALIHIDDTFKALGVRNIVTNTIGSGVLSDPWGTYVIPASIIKRPLPAAGILLGVFFLLSGISGFMMDLFVFPPVVRIGLMVGVFIPLFEIGMRLLKTARDTVGAGMCLATSLFVNPVVGWAFATMVENYGLLGPIEPERLEMMGKVMSRKTQLIISTVTFIIVFVIMGWVGLLPGVPKF